MTASDARPLAILLATGDPGLEGRLLAGLPATGVTVAARCLEATSLLEHAGMGPASFDGVLLSGGLHGLSKATIRALRDRAVRVLVLAADERQAARFGPLAPTLPASTPVADVAAALRQVSSGQWHADAGDLGERASRPEEPDDRRPRARVIGVTSGKGAPGKSTVAIALAHALGRSGLDVVLVDADLRGGNVAPYLDLDPRRGLVGLALPDAEGRTPLAEQAAAELQDGPDCRVLAGLERPALASGISHGLLAGVTATLAERSERVVVDLGAPPPPELLPVLDRLLVVSGAGLVALWNTRLALPALRAGTSASLGAVLNRREGREHYDADEVERALGVPVLATVREDRRAARRSEQRQAPLTSAGGRAARDLHALAARLEAGSEPAPMLTPAPLAVEA